MEDISRDLEKEIARSRPKPYKLVRKSRLIIVDDFGKMKSGGYLKTLIMALSIVSVVCCSAAVLFYFLYTDLSQQLFFKKTKFAQSEKKIEQLTREKEILMARLVIAGKKLTETEKKSKTEDNPAGLKTQETETITSEAEKKNKTDRSVPETQTEDESAQIINKTVTIEKFMVKNDKTKKNLLVRFDIRKISKEPGDVSGRIFTILRPASASQDQWLVVPATSLKNGVPSEYEKGQYFSIKNFKPVKFRIKNQADPDFFKKALIFVFNEQKDLIFEKLIDIK